MFKFKIIGVYNSQEGTFYKEFGGCEFSNPVPVDTVIQKVFSSITIFQKPNKLLLLADALTGIKGSTENIFYKDDEMLEYVYEVHTLMGSDNIEEFSVVSLQNINLTDFYANDLADNKYSAIEQLVIRSILTFEGLEVEVGVSSDYSIELVKDYRVGLVV